MGKKGYFAQLSMPPSKGAVKEEFYVVAFRKMFYESVEQLQRDLDQFLAFYNRERAHQVYRTQGRRPFQTLSEGVKQMLERR